MRELLQKAVAGGYAVGYFETWDQYSLEAVLEAAEESRSPVILGFGCELMNQAWYDGGGAHRLAALGLAAAQDAAVPVSLLLNEAATFEQVTRGLAWGYNAVMLDTSALPLEENIAATRRVADAAHAAGADAEGELGRLPGGVGLPPANPPAPPGLPHDSSLTNPDEAARYVAETGIDALSVSVGNVHVMRQGEAEVDLDRLARIHRAVSVPLVIHGGSGFPDRAVRRAVELGVAKFNVGTVLRQVFLDRVRETVGTLPEDVNLQEVIGSRKAADLLQPAKEAVKAEVKRRLALYSSARRA
jgi:ketose-bisphosphate aldolase